MYGPVRTVVWQGSAGDRRPYADLVGNPEVIGMGMSFFTSAGGPHQRGKYDVGLGFERRHKSNSGCKATRGAPLLARISRSGPSAPPAAKFHGTVPKIAADPSTLTKKTGKINFGKRLGQVNDRQTRRCPFPLQLAVRNSVLCTSARATFGSNARLVNLTKITPRHPRKTDSARVTPYYAITRSKSFPFRG